MCARTGIGQDVDTIIEAEGGVAAGQAGWACVFWPCHCSMASGSRVCSPRAWTDPDLSGSQSHYASEGSMADVMEHEGVHTDLPKQLRIIEPASLSNGWVLGV